VLANDHSLTHEQPLLDHESLFEHRDRHRAIGKRFDLSRIVTGRGCSFDVGVFHASINCRCDVLDVDVLTDTHPPGGFGPRADVQFLLRTNEADCVVLGQ